jgi:hypothetical protein
VGRFARVKMVGRWESGFDWLAKGEGERWSTSRFGVRCLLCYHCHVTGD